jgi:hypothetical protein
VPNINDAFPSNYLKASDIRGSEPVVTIDHVAFEPVGRQKEMKAVVYFKGKEKGVVLNKTNKNTIVGLYGTETDEWTGQPIEMFAALVDFQGKQTEAIRFRAPRLNGKPKTAPSAAHTDANPPPADEVDF